MSRIFSQIETLLFLVIENLGLYGIQIWKA